VAQRYVGPSHAALGGRGPFPPLLEPTKSTETLPPRARLRPSALHVTPRAVTASVPRVDGNGEELCALIAEFSPLALIEHTKTTCTGPTHTKTSAVQTLFHAHSYNYTASASTSQEQAKAPARFVSNIRFVQACLSVCGLCAVDIRTVFVVHWRSRRTAQICPSRSSWQQCTT
jgi:hypothetical protein